MYNQNQHYQNPPRPQGMEPSGVSLEWNEDGSYFGYCWKIFFLIYITAGIYYFWAQTDLRKKIWSCIEFMGQPLEYTGKGIELFLGYLKFVLFFQLPLIALIVYMVNSNMQQEQPVLFATIIALVAIISLYLLGVAQYGARSYRLSRTNWRGIRGAMSGSAWSYGFMYLWTTFLAVLTLGWLLPWAQNKRQKRLTEETFFGNQQLQYDGTASPLYTPFAIAWFGMMLFFLSSPIALKHLDSLENSPIEMVLFFANGIALISLLVGLVWYVVRSHNHNANSTIIDRARFGLNITAGSFIWLNISNGLLINITAGIAWPFIAKRTIRYFVDRMTINGSIDFQRIAQSQAQMNRTGEGLAQAFDIDAF